MKVGYWDIFAAVAVAPTSQEDKLGVGQRDSVEREEERLKCGGRVG